MNEKTSGTGYESHILAHYREEAANYGDLGASTMRDEITRNREIDAIKQSLHGIQSSIGPAMKIADVGCGNGFLLSTLRTGFPESDLVGIEYTDEMLKIAEGRGLSGCRFMQGDIRSLNLEESSADVVITERCIINLLNREDQQVALDEIARVVRPDGYFICIESFTDGLNDLNQARSELGLEAIAPPHHNLWLDKQWFRESVTANFDVVNEVGNSDPWPQQNFLSSHYFVSRVLYPLVTQADVQYNTHLVKFFSYLPPVGNYAPIQLHVLQRKG